MAATVRARAPLLLLLLLPLLLQLLQVSQLAAAAAVAEEKKEKEEVKEEKKEEKEKEKEAVRELRPSVAFTPGFPEAHLRLMLGQVSGVTIDKRGHSFLFQRGGRTWDDDAFTKDNKYTHVNRGPIKEPTVIEVDAAGRAVAAYGLNAFYLPHDITIDNKNQIWATDVARHQVLRLNLRTGEVQPVLGEAFVPGNDSKHLCQPTQVAVASNGDFFVADGYCNNRVMKFNKDGKFLGQFGRKPSAGKSLAPDEFEIPHGLALLERMDLLCVADRENKRVQCFNAGIRRQEDFGKFVKSVDHRLGRVYDIDFLPNGELLILHMLDENDFSLVNIHNLVTGATVGQFTHVNDDDGLDQEKQTSVGLGEAHSIAASPSGQFALVGSLSASCDTRRELCELGLAAPYQVFRFRFRQPEAAAADAAAAAAAAAVQM